MQGSRRAVVLRGLAIAWHLSRTGTFNFSTRAGNGRKIGTSRHVCTHWEVAMAKVLRCGDVMPGCDKIITGKSVDEVMAKAETHARKEHNMVFIPPRVIGEIEAAIKDGEGAGPAR